MFKIQAIAIANCCFAVEIKITNETNGLTLSRFWGVLSRPKGGPPTTHKKNAMQHVILHGVFIYGGEGEIRTLGTCVHTRSRRAP